MGIVEVNGARLWTEVTGKGVPLLLCHGGPGAPDYLGPLAELLPARVHRFEQRGCGRSADAEPNDIAALLGDIDALRAHWRLERFVMAGHSWGAALALLYALEHPGRVERLLYLNGMGIKMGWEKEHGAEAARRLTPELRARRGELERDGRFEEAFRLALAADVADPAVLPRVRALFDRPFRRDVNQRLHREWVELTDDPALPARVAQCEIPALVLQGERDSRPNWPAAKLATLLPRARYVALADAGHFPWMERPEAFLAEVAGFVSLGA